MERSASPQLAAARAIKILGGPVRAAITLKVPGFRYQTVQSWLRNRVPAEYCPVIERETRALGDTVTCEDLRDDVAWEVLRLQSVASDQQQGA